MGSKQVLDLTGFFFFSSVPSFQTRFRRSPERPAAAPRPPVRRDRAQRDPGSQRQKSGKNGLAQRSGITAKPEAVSDHPVADVRAAVLRHQRRSLLQCDHLRSGQDDAQLLLGEHHCCRNTGPILKDLFFDPFRISVNQSLNDVSLKIFYRGIQIIL